MIRIDNVEVFGWEAAIRGARNPMNSWDKSDSRWEFEDPETAVDPEDPEMIYVVGKNDLDLMKRLVAAGSDHSKFMRMINVTFDISMPLYFAKQLDTYKVGTVANSCSTMHRIHTKEFTINDFSYEHLDGLGVSFLEDIIKYLNVNREHFNKTKDKDSWWNMIQSLPSSYNQLRTVQLNYAVLKNMYHARKNHKLDEWVDFCKWIETLPLAKELICS